MPLSLRLVTGGLRTGISDVLPDTAYLTIEGNVADLVGRAVPGLEIVAIPVRPPMFQDDALVSDARVRVVTDAEGNISSTPGNQLRFRRILSGRVVVRLEIPSLNLMWDLHVPSYTPEGDPLYSLQLKDWIETYRAESWYNGYSDLATARSQLRDV